MCEEHGEGFAGGVQDALDRYWGGLKEVGQKESRPSRLRDDLEAVARLQERGGESWTSSG